MRTITGSFFAQGDRSKRPFVEHVLSRGKPRNRSAAIGLVANGRTSSQGMVAVPNSANQGLVADLAAQKVVAAVQAALQLYDLRRIERAIDGSALIVNSGYKTLRPMTCFITEPVRV